MRSVTPWRGFGHRASRAPCSPDCAAAYRLLGLEPGADARRVRQAFRKLAAAHHPDRYLRTTPRERAAMTRRFSELTAAYHSIVT